MAPSTSRRRSPEGDRKALQKELGKARLVAGLLAVQSAEVEDSLHHAQRTTALPA
jgi:hypothetical protein